MGAANVKVEPMRVIYGEDKAPVEKIICHGDTASTPLNNKWFAMYIAGVKHVFWFNVASGGTAPTGTGGTLHAVAIAALADGTAVATALSAIISGVGGNSVSNGVNIVEVTHSAPGYQSSADDAPGADATKFGFQIIEQGSSEEDIGELEGDIEVSFEETFAEVKAHATGTTPISVLKTGVSGVEITLNMLETTMAILKKLMTKTGGAFTPGAGTEVFGMGTFKNFENMMKFAEKLRLHPVRLLDGDLSEDWNFHKAIPKMKGITFSGENVLKLPLTFQVFPDTTKNSRVNYFSIGDGSQDLSK